MVVLALVLYVLGGALEVAGILLVVAELRSDRKRALEVAAIRVPHVGLDPLRQSPKAPSWTIQGALDEQRELEPQRAQAETSRKLQRALVDMLEENQRVRRWGVRLLVAGVMVATAGNVVGALA
jgi:hypothetical protein